MSDGRGKVVVGISPSLPGLEALRFAIAEARRRQVPLAAVRALVIGAARQRWWSGAVVRGCARNAGCPVVVVPAPELARMVGGRMTTRRLDREAAATLAHNRDTNGS